MLIQLVILVEDFYRFFSIATLTLINYGSGGGKGL